jgi:3-oxoacyl-[acyl-carrier protein] reductase
VLEKEFPDKQVDILVNCAGVSPLKPLHSETLESLTETLTANVTFPALLLRSLLPLLSKTGTGRVVNVSSEGSHLGRANTSAYSASKAALESLTRTWAKELGREYSGLTVNSLCLGLTKTGLFEALPAARQEFWRAKVEEENAVAGRLGTPREVAEVVGFLVGDGGGWVSGQCIGVGGGGLMIA